MTVLAKEPTTYWDYIRVPELLELQGGLERNERGISQEEVVFITIHQVYELWLKLLLRDLVVARDLFAQPHVPDDALAGACRLLGRHQLAHPRIASCCEVLVIAQRPLVRAGLARSTGQTVEHDGAVGRFRRGHHPFVQPKRPRIVVVAHLGRLGFS